MRERGKERSRESGLVDRNWQCVECGCIGKTIREKLGKEKKDILRGG